MFKYLVLFVIFALSCSLLSQEVKIPPDYRKIASEIASNDSKFYYPGLFDRYVKNDTTLTPEDFHYLYYGYSFQKKYDPYFHHDSIPKFFQTLNKQNLNLEETSYLIGLGTKILQDDPFNIGVMNILAYLYHEQGKDDMARIIGRKDAMVIGAILNSGDGTTDSTAFYVISTSDEYSIINFHRLNFLQQALSQSKGQVLDVMTVEDESKNKNSMYFNVTRLFEVEHEKLNK